MLVWSVSYSLLIPSLERYLSVGRPKKFLQKTVFFSRWGGLLFGVKILLCRRRPPPQKLKAEEGEKQMHL